MNWDDVGDALLKAVRLASRLEQDQVIWKHQNYNAPAEDYVAIQLQGAVTIGIDSLKQTYSAARPRGQEFKIEVRGTREATLEIEFFSTGTVSGRSVSALSGCAQIVAGLRLPSVRHVLQQQQIAAFDPGVVRWIPDVPNTGFRGRAACSVRCYIPAPTVEEYAGFIERMSGDVTIQGSASGDVVQDFDTNAAEANAEYESNVTLDAVTISPSSEAISQFLGTVQLRATAESSTGDTWDVTNRATWSSDNGFVIVDATGLATAFGAGTANIRATYQGVQSDPAVITAS